MVDNQEYLLFCDSDEKGNCKIIQCSGSFAYLLSFQKYEIIGKSLEIIYPELLLEEHTRFLEESILCLHNENNQKFSSYQDNNNTNNFKLIMVKNRMGYVIPLYASYTVSVFHAALCGLFGRYKHYHRRGKAVWRGDHGKL